MLKMNGQPSTFMSNTHKVTNALILAVFYVDLGCWDQYNSLLPEHICFVCVIFVEFSVQSHLNSHIAFESQHGGSSCQLLSLIVSQVLESYWVFALLKFFFLFPELVITLFRSEG
jgi:hypothetical protein